MSTNDLNHELNRLVELGGILRNVKEAKTTIHNTENLGGGDNDRSRLLVDITAREALVERRIGLVQEKILEAYQDALEHHPLIFNGTLRAPSLSATPEPEPTFLSPGEPIDLDDVKIGDMLDVKPRLAPNDRYLGGGVYGVTINKFSDITGLPSFVHESGHDVTLLRGDEIYLVHRPKPLPTEPGSWIEVTDHAGQTGDPFKAVLHADGGWRMSIGLPGKSLAVRVLAKNIRDFHELELTRKENA